MIREISNDNELEKSIDVIKESFATVAKDFNLTEMNCPTNPAFITFEKLKEIAKKGIRMFGLYYNDKQVGFVAIEKSDNANYYMEKLSVLPEYRHNGFGKKLMDFVFDFIHQENGESVSIGIINENAILKNWYKKYGFIETGTKQFEHLPFVVCFMERKI